MFLTRHRYAQNCPARGFTLLEIMIALAVVALALVALVNSASTQLRIFERTREKTFAGWAASNVLADMRLRDGFPEPGERSGTQIVAGIRFVWRARVQTTVDSDLRRIDLRVSLKTDDIAAPELPVLTRTAFAARR